jgi:histidine triad (HIT) family protein
MSNCVFCELVKNPGKAKVIYEDDQYLAFEDIHPQAPVHFLVIPKSHFETILDADPATLSGLMHVAAREAAKRGLSDDGFRTVINCKRHGGQTVYHLHAHIMGGRWFSWPPG